jgi:sortase B
MSRARYNKRNKKRNRKQARGSRIILNIMMLIAIGVLVFSVYQIAMTLMPYHQGRQLNQQIRDTYTQIEVVAAQGSEGVTEAEEEPRERFIVDFDSLRETNSDTVAWLRFVEPAIINYPVVISHDNVEYLTRGFDGSFNQLGSIFMDMGNSIDFTDRNTIIYGHNMAVGGEMFSQLTEFSDIEFIRENPYFFIHTPDGMMRTYRIFMAAVVGDLSPIYQIDFLDDEDFEEYLELSRNISIHTIDGDDLNRDAMIVTLSTCTNVVATDRFIIQGVLVEEEIH